MLKPNRIVQKYLSSSTCRFVGEFETDKLFITHAWPNLHGLSTHQRLVQGPAARSGFVISFETDSADHDGLVVPSYNNIGDMLCSFMSVLFGKRFDNHGPLEESGHFHIPDLTAFNTLCNHTLPQNNHSPRPDFSIPLNLQEIDRLASIIFRFGPSERQLDGFRGAAKFYWQALQAAEHDTEVAYLHLITAGEMLCGFVDVPDDCLVDAQSRAILTKIQERKPDGEKDARIIRSKLRSIRRRFISGFMSLTDDGFFSRSEVEDSYAQLKAASFARSLAGAYDLRSRYVHTGRSFGRWVAPRGTLGHTEVQVGRPVIEDKDFARIIHAAPTYIGLERIVRYGLLRFVERLGVNLGSR